jgi:hypothetical protein
VDSMFIRPWIHHLNPVSLKAEPFNITILGSSPCFILSTTMIYMQQTGRHGAIYCRVKPWMICNNVTDKSHTKAKASLSLFYLSSATVADRLLTTTNAQGDNSAAFSNGPGLLGLQAVHSLHERGCIVHDRYLDLTSGQVIVLTLSTAIKQG